MSQSLHDARGALRGARKRARRTREWMFLRAYHRAPGRSLAGLAAEANAVMLERMDRLAEAILEAARKDGERQARAARLAARLRAAEPVLSKLERAPLTASLALRLEAKLPRFGIIAGEKVP